MVVFQMLNKQSKHFAQRILSEAALGASATRWEQIPGMVGSLLKRRPFPAGSVTRQAPACGPDPSAAFAGISPRARQLGCYPAINSAIWTVLRAAPLRRLSATQNSSRAFGSN